MHISFIFLFFDRKPGSCHLICGIIIVNKSFSSAKAALVCSFRASGKNRRHLGCRNIVRSRGCAVQNKGITLIGLEFYYVEISLVVQVNNGRESILSESVNFPFIPVDKGKFTNQKCIHFLFDNLFCRVRPT